MRLSSARSFLSAAVAPVMLAISAFLLFACASKPDRTVDEVQMITSGQKEKCKSLGNFTVEQKGGPDKPGSVLNKARAEVIRRGGNGIYVISSSVDWEQGVTMSAEALQCQS